MPRHPPEEQWSYALFTALLYGQTSRVVVMWIWTVSERDVHTFVVCFLNGGREEVAN